MEGFDGLDEESESETWFRMRATAGTSSDCARMRLPGRKYRKKDKKL